MKTKVRKHTRKSKKGREHSVKKHSRRAAPNNSTPKWRRPTPPKYKKIYRKAKRKGYRLPRLSQKKGPLVIQEVNIPESKKYTFDGFVMNPGGGDKHDIYFMGIDDDAAPKEQLKTAAHELGHVHMILTKEKPHTETKADKIAAHILDMPITEFNKRVHSVVVRQRR